MIQKENTAERGEFHKTVLDAFPSPVFVVEKDVRIIDLNAAAARMVGKDRAFVLRRKGGDVLHCIHSKETLEGCGKAPYCKECVVRNSVNESLTGLKLVRQKAKLELVRGEKVLEVYMLITTTPFEYDNELIVLLILEDITEIMTLRAMLPICAKCKKIRDDQAYWHSVESYLKAHSDIQFTHSICPQCAKELYPDFLLSK
jgi:PAS domain-containing protein